MTSSRKPKKTKPKVLLVEGKNDQHVIWHLCEQHQLPEEFYVDTPTNTDDVGGVEFLLNDLAARRKTPGLKTLGIVVDADLDMSARWEAVRNRLIQLGYANLPNNMPKEGLVHEHVVVPDSKLLLPKVGVWIMPDNQATGILEDFVKLMIPDDDRLLPRAEKVLREIEAEKLSLYSEVKYPKALIHTWLAWQESPGMPMGQSITARVLRHDAAIATLFVNWLRQLFDLHDSEPVPQV
jgi:hypothetical protein